MKRSPSSLGFFFVALVAIKQWLPFAGILTFVGLAGLAAYFFQRKEPEPDSPTSYDVRWGGCDFIYFSEGHKPLGVFTLNCYCVPTEQSDKTIGSLPDTGFPVYLSKEAGELFVVSIPPPLRSRDGLRSKISCP